MVDPGLIVAGFVPLSRCCDFKLQVSCLRSGLRGLPYHTLHLECVRACVRTSPGVSGRGLQRIHG